MKTEKLKILTTILFYSSEPIQLQKLREFLKLSDAELTKLKKQLIKKLSGLGLMLIETDSQLQVVTQPRFSKYLKNFYSLQPQLLSQASLEVLAIIAHQQPITAMEIDEIRGVNSEQTIKNLINKELIERDTTFSNHHKKIYYKTTPNFLKTLGISKLSDLKNG